MSDSITITGIVATIPNVIETSQRLSIASFRLASTHRRYDRAKNEWVDGDTNWYTITAFRQLATNISASLRKGERVIVSGRLKIREWSVGDKSGTNIEVEADSLGHDLSWGTATFTRVSRAAAPAQPVPAEALREESRQAATESGVFDTREDETPDDAAGDDALAQSTGLTTTDAREDVPF